MAIPRIELPVELLAEVFLAVQLTPEFVASLGFSSESARLLLLCQCANEFAGRPFRRILALRQQIFQAPFPFTCPVCGQVFKRTQKGNLMAHVGLCLKKRKQ